MKSRVRLLVLFVGLAVVACNGRSESSSGSSAAEAPAGTPKVEIAFLNHPPVRGALTAVDALLTSYGDKITVIRYDLETDEGAQFEKSKRLTGHVPIAIFINGSMEFKLKDHSVKFFSFPQGKGTFMVASGSWTVDDLRQAIDQALNRVK